LQFKYSNLAAVRHLGFDWKRILTILRPLGTHILHQLSPFSKILMIQPMFTTRCSGAILYRLFLRVVEKSSISNLGSRLDTTIIAARSQTPIRFNVASKLTVVKIEVKFCTFHHCKRGRVCEMSESRFQGQPRTQPMILYF